MPAFYLAAACLPAPAAVSAVVGADATANLFTASARASHIPGRAVLLATWLGLVTLTGTLAALAFPFAVLAVVVTALLWPVGFVVGACGDAMDNSPGQELRGSVRGHAQSIPRLVG
jgi:hypothetical protein